MSAAGLGDDATAEPSSSKPGRRAQRTAPQAIPSAEKDSRDPVPLPTCDKTISEAPAPTTEASPATKKIPDSGHQGSPPHKATLSAEHGDEDEGVTFHDLVALFGSDDEDGDPPRSAQTSSSSAARRPSGVSSPYRSSSDEDDSSDDEGPRDPSIAKRPSLPSSSPSTPMEVGDDGGRSRKDAGGDSRGDEPSFDFLSGDTAGEEAVPAPTEGSSPAGGAGDVSTLARSDVPGGEGSPADSGHPSADKGTLAVPRSPTPPRRTLSPPTSPQCRLPPPGSARSRVSSLPQEAGPGRMIVATYTSRLRYGDPSPAQPLSMSHQVV
ncbi:hypothetical protein GQ600_26060 [Phytophthora cactorum]|nr:hypothetical protein GQ600_26060 [Phytophthora cactorum]